MCHQDFTWLREIQDELRYQARPRPKHHRIIDSERLLALGLELVERGESAFRSVAASAREARARRLDDRDPQPLPDPPRQSPLAPAGTSNSADR